MDAQSQNPRILTSYYRPKPGGLCKRLFRGIRALLDRGYEVHYLAVTRFPISDKRCHFHRFPWPQDRTDNVVFWAIFHFLSPFILLYIGFKYRITHAFAFGSTYALVMQPVRVLKRIPLSVFLRADAIRNHELKDAANWIVTIERLLEGIAIHGAHVYGVSRALIEAVANRHRWARPIHTGVLRNDLNLIDRAVRPGVSGPLRFGCVGILEKRKNHIVVLEAMQGIPAERGHLYVYGSGPDGLLLQQKANELGVQEKVTFMGWRPAEEIWAEINVLLMPSLHEGAPNAVLEALAHGVPVLASRIPEHREILPDRNLIIPESPKAWEHRLKAIANAPESEMDNLRKEAAPSVERLNFDWDEEVSRAIAGGGTN